MNFEALTKYELNCMENFKGAKWEKETAMLRLFCCGGQGNGKPRKRLFAPEVSETAIQIVGIAHNERVLEGAEK